MILDCKQPCPLLQTLLPRISNGQSSLRRQSPTKACHATLSMRHEAQETQGELSPNTHHLLLCILAQWLYIKETLNSVGQVKRLVLLADYKGSKTYSILYSASYYVCFCLS